MDGQKYYKKSAEPYATRIEIKPTRSETSGRKEIRLAKKKKVAFGVQFTG